jgi:hypothetical protein
MAKNLWYLTEERPKKEVLQTIFEKFAEDHDFEVSIETIRIIPILAESKFTFTYEVTGLVCSQVNRVFIKTISGNSSFTDFLIFYQDHEPTLSDEPVYAIEETKTDDHESRNTGVYQRCTKFVFIENYYPGVRKIMLYNIQVGKKKSIPSTIIFGTKLLKTLDVEILGKNVDDIIFNKFQSIDEVIDFKAKMKKAPKGNVPILLNKIKGKIQVSGRLYKDDGLKYDPNIGALSIICAVLRKLGWEEEIEIILHGLEQKHLKKPNKFIHIANNLSVSLLGLIIPSFKPPTNYWKYETDGEKLGTIFIHLVVENFTLSRAIFENHAGCEKGYFICDNGDHIPLAKYKNVSKYKAGDKSQIIYIPDLLLIDLEKREVINIEGKQYVHRKNGIDELNNYEYIEDNYILRFYPGVKIFRTVVLYGGVETSINEPEIGFLLNNNGEIVLGQTPPSIFREAIENLIEFWK